MATITLSASCEEPSDTYLTPWCGESSVRVRPGGQHCFHVGPWLETVGSIHGQISVSTTGHGRGQGRGWGGGGVPGGGIAGGPLPHGYHGRDGGPLLGDMSLLTYTWDPRPQAAALPTASHPQHTWKHGQINDLETVLGGLPREGLPGEVRLGGSLEKVLVAGSLERVSVEGVPRGSQWRVGP